MKKIVAAIDSAEQRKEVEKLLDEFQRTGNVIRNVSPEQRTVQKVRIERPELRPSPIEVHSAITSDLISPRTERAKPEPKTEARNKESKTEMNVRENAPVASDIAAEKTSKRSQLTTGSPIVDAPAIGQLNVSHGR